MFSNFFRTSVYAAGLLLMVRLYLGWNWLTSGFGKAFGEFNASGFIQGAIAEPVGGKGNEATYPLFTAFLENVALPMSNVFSFMVAWGEVLVGLGLLVGIMTVYASFFGVVMNFTFLFAGTISSNPWMILLSIFLLVAGHHAGYFGGDRWVQPYFAKKIPSLFKENTNKVKEIKKIA